MTKIPFLWLHPSFFLFYFLSNRATFFPGFGKGSRATINRPPHLAHILFTLKSGDPQNYPQIYPQILPSNLPSNLPSKLPSNLLKITQIYSKLLKFTQVNLLKITLKFTLKITLKLTLKSGATVRKMPQKRVSELYTHLWPCKLQKEKMESF